MHGKVQVKKLPKKQIPRNDKVNSGENRNENNNEAN